MIALSDATRLMNRAVRRFKDTLLEEGSVFPVLILYKKGADMQVQGDYPGVVLIQNSSKFDHMPNDFQACDGLWINISQIVFSYGDGIEEEQMNEVARELTKQHVPDMVGFLMSCLYTGNSDGRSIYLNPDVTRLIHSVFYTPAQNDGKVLFMPYICRGELPLEKQRLANGINDAINYDVTFVDSGWSSSAGKSVKPSIENPYGVLA